MIMSVVLGLPSGRTAHYVGRYEDGDLGGEELVQACVAVTN